MKKALLLLTASIAVYSSHAQNSNEIAVWMSQHPTTYVISEANYDKMSQARKDQLQDRIIVYKNEITIEQLVAYAPMKSANAQSDPARDSDLAEIKEWLALNPDIKIIQRSQFDSMSQNEQTMYQEIHALILIGEEITVQDIRNY
jgi:hypothetical protein